MKRLGRPPLYDCRARSRRFGGHIVAACLRSASLHAQQHASADSLRSPLSFEPLGDKT